MTFREFHKKMVSFVVFSIEDISGVLGGIDRRRLFEWSKKGYIIPVKRGHYLFAEFKNSHNLGLLIANKIYEPSYMSLEYVLSLEGLIPEAVFTYTNVTSKKTQTFNTTFGHFLYRHVKPALFAGYGLKKEHFFVHGERIDRLLKIAYLENAFFDFIYFKHGIMNNEMIAGYRFDRDVLESMDNKKLSFYIRLANDKGCHTNIQKIFSHYDITR
jgi:hypothetical protein